MTTKVAHKTTNVSKLIKRYLFHHNTNYIYIYARTITGNGHCQQLFGVVSKLTSKRSTIYLMSFIYIHTGTKFGEKNKSTKKLGTCTKEYMYIRVGKFEFAIKMSVTFQVKTFKRP